ncbi:Inhibitor of growth protein [Aphelenchoides fujianensis]|nr:Inhibitor of growth protein [Aphelenchoides fujianensis]
MPRSPPAVKKMKKFRQNIGEVSAPVRENLRKIAELDRECAEKQEFVERLTVPTILNWTKSNRDVRQKRYKALKTALEKLERDTEQKVKLASQCYEQVDQQVTKLDKIYAKILQKRKSPAFFHSKKPDEPKTSGRRDRKQKEKTPEKEVAFDPTLVVDMPIDPNEPTYCICRNVSFGQMVACENPMCPIEWFHFECMGLTSEPKGKWFCPNCRLENQKSRK